MKEKSDWEVVVGLEVHAQVSSKAKLFSGASTSYGGAPNTQVDLLDAGMPGILPVINKLCIEQAIKTGLGLNAKINLLSIFDRKNYFYADLPQGYQISQYKWPIVGEGRVAIELSEGRVKEIGIERLHLEQDAGKSLHDQDPKLTFVDLNRSGVALMEIVSKPDMNSPMEAGIYLRKIRSILRYLETCDGDMEKGSLRADVNVSVRKKGDKKLNTRCEIKNLNSIKFVEQAIEVEKDRQIEILEQGGQIEQETRLFDTSKNVTRPMRSKEDAHDYRYFPDPDLVPLRLDENWIKKIILSLPELPDMKKKRFVKQYQITSYDADILVSEKDIADYFEEVAKGRDPKVSSNWIIGELFGLLKKKGIQIRNSPITPKNLGKIIDLIKRGSISSRIAKDVLVEVAETNKDPEVIVKEKDLLQVSDTKEIDTIVDTIIQNHKDKVEEYLSGKEKLFGFFVGQVMKESKGKANPQLVNQILNKKLKK